MIQLPSWKCGGITHTTREMQQVPTNSLFRMKVRDSLGVVIMTNTQVLMLGEGWKTPELPLQISREQILSCLGDWLTKVPERAKQCSILQEGSLKRCRDSYSPSSQPPERHNRDGEQDEGPTIQEEMVSNVQPHLDTHKSIELAYTPGHQGSWWKRSPSHFPSLISHPGMSYLTGGQQMSCPSSARRAGRTTQLTTNLSV